MNPKLKFIKKRLLNAEFILLFIMIFVALFIYPRALLLIFAYFIIVYFIDIYKVIKIAWNNQNDIHKPLENNGFGFMLIGFLFGSGIWFYIDSLNYFNHIIIEIISIILLVIFIPSLISSFVLVYGIAIIQKYKRNELI